MTRLRAGAATDVGRVRSVNQDRLLVHDGLWAVADGMGGHAAGDVAARVAVETLQERFDPATGTTGLVSAIQAANAAVLDQARADAQLRGMGTTLTVVADVSADGGGDELVVANIGDSRAYLLQSSELSQLTADHSLVEELVRAGELTPLEAAGHPQRHIVTRALGIDAEVDVDTWTLAPHPGDRFLVCSDGLSNEVDDAGIAEVLRHVPDAQAAADRLVEMARAHGGTDNITVIVLDVLDSGEAAPPPPPPSPAATSVVPEVAEPDVSAPVVAPPVVAPPVVAPPVVAPPVVAPPARPAAPPAETAARSRRITVRVVIFTIAVVAVLVGAAVAIVWYARSSYYVGLKGEELVIYQGRPGGVLGMNPTLKERTGVSIAQVPSADVPGLQKGIVEASLADARKYVTNLVSELQASQNLQYGGYATSTTSPPTATSSGSAGTATTASTTTTAPRAGGAP